MDLSYYLSASSVQPIGLHIVAGNQERVKWPTPENVRRRRSDACSSSRGKDFCLVLEEKTFRTRYEQILDWKQVWWVGDVEIIEL